MEDTTLLLDYVTTIQMNQVDAAYQKIENLANEIQSGLDVFHNAEVVSTYGDKYGYTEHFKELIGDEALMDQAKGLLSTFIAWLKKKLTQLVSFIFYFIRSIMEMFTVFVWAIVNMSKLQNTVAPYDIGDLTIAYTRFYKSLQRRVVDLEFAGRTPINDYLNQLKEALDAHYNNLVTDIERAKHNVDCKRIDFHASAMVFQSYLENTLRVELNTMAEGLDRLQKSLNEKDTEAVLNQKLSEAIRRIPVLERYSDIYPNLTGRWIDKDNTLGMLQGRARFLIQICTMLSGTYTKAIRKGVSILKELHEAYNKGEASIHMEFPVDQSFVKRLSDFYGGPLKITTIVFTNTAPSTWSVANEFEGLMGWCYAGRGSGTSFPTEFWINTRMLTSWWNRFTVAFASEGRVNIYDYFLNVMVHECKHLWDLQHGEHFDDVEKVKYKNQDHEIRANAASAKFEITDRDRSWAKKIIDQVLAEIKKQKSK